MDYGVHVAGGSVPLISGTGLQQYNAEYFVGSISGTTLTVTSVSSPTKSIRLTDWQGTSVQRMIYNKGRSGIGTPNIIDGTYIVNQLTGTPGGIGTYTVSQSQTVTSGNILTEAIADFKVDRFVGDCYTVIGCRSETASFVRSGDASVTLIGCAHLNAGDQTIFLDASADASVISCSSVAGRIINGVGRTLTLQTGSAAFGNANYLQWQGPVNRYPKTNISSVANRILQQSEGGGALDNSSAVAEVQFTLPSETTDGWVFLGSITGTTLTIAFASTNFGVIPLGSVLYGGGGGGVAAGTFISAYIDDPSHLLGNYAVSNSQSVSSGTFTINSGRRA